MPQKPTGNIGPLHFTNNPDGNNLEWDKICFSKSKEEIERYICSRFINQLDSSIKFEQNEENDFDFTLNSPTGKVYLDLAEITLNSSGNPYNDNNIKITYREYTDSVYKIVNKKSSKYPAHSNTPIQLLLYYTHWRFAPTSTAIAMIQNDLRTFPLMFDRIYLYHPMDKDSGIVEQLYPIPNDYDFGGFDFNKKKNEDFYTLNPETFQLVPSGFSVPFKL